MNTIGRVKFDFAMQNEIFAQSLYAGWDHFFSASFEAVADELLKRFEVESEVIEIDTLHLDLGTLSEADFYEKFPLRLREAMEESLQNILFQSKSTALETETVKRHSVQKKTFDLLCYFLLHGMLPWYVSTGEVNISDLFLQVIRDNPGELKQFLQLYGHYTTLQQRLVYQLNDPALEEGVRLMRSAESTFISSYVYYLREKYSRLEQPQITETNYRYAIWHVVYAWMLTDRSSSFDKKSFLQRTISGLAIHLNITYMILLAALTKEIDNLAHKQSQLPELLRLLSALMAESTLQLQKEKLSDLTGLFDLLGSSMQKEINKQLAKTSFSPMFLAEWLIPLLSRADSCRSLLLQMKEEEIIRLIPIVMPDDSEFIIGYARFLDKQKEQGALQGKAGSEFSRLKWMVIFPVLLENKGAGFNRKYFVRKVLQSVAARYNLAFRELLIYFMQYEIVGKQDPALLEILESFYKEIKKEIAPDATREQSKVTGLIQKLSANSPFTEEDRNTLIRLWTRPQEAISFVRRLSEKEYTALITIVAKGYEQFVLHYATALDHSRQQGLLEGKTSGDFRYIKWYFIFRVLVDKKGASVNRRHLTSTVLRDLAAHYNLAYFDLLQYFYTREHQKHLPPALSLILQELYRKERQQQINSLLYLSADEERYKLLEKLYPSETPFIRSLLKLMNNASFRQKIGADSSYSRLLWEKIFRVLDENTGQPFVKQICLHRFMQLLAIHYKVKTEILYTYLSNSLRQGTTTTPELKQIIMDQSNLWNNLDFIQPQPESNNAPQPDSYYVNNAGMVLIAPFFPHLFRILELVEKNARFTTPDSQIRAIFLSQYAVYGKHTQRNYPEQELILNKILTGYDSTIALPNSYEITEKDKEVVDGMLKGVLSNWSKLSRTPIDTLRVAFLDRPGALKIGDDRYYLTIDEKAYDILMDSLPWNFRMIKFPWMEKRMEVKWR